MNETDKDEILIQMRIAIAELKASMVLQFAALEAARKIQATEYERRLETLNNKTEERKEAEGKFVDKFVYEADKKANTGARQLAITIAASSFTSLAVVGLMLIFGR